MSFQEWWKKCWPNGFTSDGDEDFELEIYEWFATKEYLV